MLRCLRFNTQLIVLIAATFLAPGCDGTDPSGLDRASLQIEMPDSVLFGESVAAVATVLEADGVRIDDADVEWISSNPHVLRFDPQQRSITAVRPGTAMIRAQAGSVSDSLAVRVSTAECSTIAVLGDVGSNFRWSFVTPGRLSDAHGEPVQYMQTPMVYGAGIMYGTAAANTVSAIYPANPRNDFKNGVACEAEDGSPYHAIFGLRTAAPTVPGLTVLSDVYAFADEHADDFLLLSYSFTNDGSEAISRLSVGMGVDLDVYEAATNVANFDPAGGVADAVAQDSAARPIVTGLMAIDETVASYRAYLIDAPEETPAILYDFMTSGIVGPNRTQAGDARQILAIAPFNLQPGETRTVWFALVGGENRNAFNVHVSEALAKARSLRGDGQ